VQPTPPSDPTHPESLPHDTQAPTRLSYATVLLVRGLLWSLSYVSGATTGFSLVALVLYQPTDWRWAWVSAGGVLAGACAVWLIPYFPAPTRKGR
jgi:hypothetical protein